MSQLEKYSLLNEFFGISAIQIENITRTQRERTMKIK
jgi:hypothetical protein